MARRVRLLKDAGEGSAWSRRRRRPNSRSP